MIHRRGLLAAVAATVAIRAADRAHAVPDDLDRPGIVVALRHALAPGTGDPPGFVLDDCTTQRNLDARGRTQAQAMGERLREAGLGDAAVFSSRWCRCLETARLLGVGPVTPLPALDSFFGQRSEGPARTAALRAFLAEQGADGPPLVLVTHQVNISGLTGRGARSGEGVVLQRGPNGTLSEHASLPPPPA